MSNKERLFEIFRKVNEVSPNHYGMDQEQWDDFHDSVVYGIMDHFKGDNHLFDKGVPNKLVEDTMELGQIELNLIDDLQERIQHVKSFDDQIEYVANYETKINEIPVMVRIPFTVFIEQVLTGTEVEFRSYVKASPTEIDVKLD